MPGEEATLELRLKLLADVGLVGAAERRQVVAAAAPDAGAAQGRRLSVHDARAGARHDPDDDAGRQLVLADIPGLIEGAAEGAGLGHEFLAHVERTSLLVHVVDVAPIDGSEPWDAFTTVRGELERYGAGLEERPFFVVLNKIDLLPPRTSMR